MGAIRRLSAWGSNASAASRFWAALSLFASAARNSNPAPMSASAVTIRFSPRSPASLNSKTEGAGGVLSAFIPLSSDNSATVNLPDSLKLRFAGKFFPVLRLYRHECQSVLGSEVRWSSRELGIPNGRRQIIGNEINSLATGSQAAPTDYRCLLIARKYRSKAEAAAMA